MGDLKLTIIGGGSSYTPELIEGLIINYHVLPIDELVLVDIAKHKERLNIIENLAKRMYKKANITIEISSTTNRKKALIGSTFVISQIRVGGLEARALDESIPLKYNLIGQETTGIGGFFKALRTIPIALDIAKDMEEVCKDAWLINFTNPSGIITEAILNHTSIKCIGLCNVPINMRREIAKEMDLTVDDLYLEFIGLNHLSWVTKILYKGKNILDTALKEENIVKSIVENIPDVKGVSSLIRNINIIPSPYLNYYYFRDNMFSLEKKEYDEKGTTRANHVMKIDKELFEIYSNLELSKKPDQLSKRGGALYSTCAISLIKSIYNNTGDIHVINVKNNGIIPSLSKDSVIETNCIVNSSGAFQIACGKVPDIINPLIVTVKNYEKLTIEAAINGDRHTAYLALLNHPLVGDVSKLDAVLNELLDAHRKYLPRFFK